MCLRIGGGRYEEDAAGPGRRPRRGQIGGFAERNGRRDPVAGCSVHDRTRIPRQARVPAPARRLDRGDGVGRAAGAGRVGGRPRRRRTPARARVAVGGPRPPARARRRGRRRAARFRTVARGRRRYVRLSLIAHRTDEAEPEDIRRPVRGLAPAADRALVAAARSSASRAWRSRSSSPPDDDGETAARLSIVCPDRARERVRGHPARAAIRTAAAAAGRRPPPPMRPHHPAEEALRLRARAAQLPEDRQPRGRSTRC